MKILIPDKPGRNVREAIDSLTQNNYQVEIAIPLKSHEKNDSMISRLVFAEMARGTSKKWSISSPFQSLSGYLKDITNLLEREKFDIVMPFSHGAVAACSYGKNEIEKFSKLIFPEFGTFMKFHDKWQTFQLCKETGVPAPKTWKPACSEDLEHIAAHNSFPLVIKIQMGCGIKRGVRVAKNKDELFEKYNELKSQESFGFLVNFESPLIQEFLEGPIHDVVGLFDKGEPVAVMSQKRVLTLPIDGGTGSVNETTDEPQAIEYACRLMKAIKWTGPAMCEFKKTDEENYSLLEVNPKFWGTLALAIAAGLDIPTLSARLFHDGKVEKIKSYNVGLTYRWSLSEEIKSLAQYNSKAKALKEYILRTFKKNKKSELKLRTPVRSILILLNTIRYLLFSKDAGDTLLQ